MTHEPTSAQRRIVGVQSQQRAHAERLQNRDGLSNDERLNLLIDMAIRAARRRRQREGGTE